MKKAMKLVFTGMLVTAFGLGLSGCRDEEQNRVLNYQKGTYLGAQDQSLSDTKVNDLVRRSAYQSYY